MALSPTIYPRERVRPALQLAGAGAGAPVIPTIRLWPFALEEITAGDRRAASPFFKGPAVVDYLYVNYQDDNTNPKPAITVWYGATVAPSGNAAIVDLSTLGTPMFTDDVVASETANVFQTPKQHLSKVSGGAATGRQLYPIRFPIYLQSFQLLIQFGTQTAGSQFLAGHFRVIEQVPLDQISNFL